MRVEVYTIYYTILFFKSHITSGTEYCSMNTELYNRKEILEFLIIMEDNNEKMERWIKEYERVNRQMGLLS